MDIQKGILKLILLLMRNFKEDDAFVQKIKILNPAITERENSSSNQKMQYDVQFFPEGGNLIDGVQSMVGVKVINQNGYGVAIDTAVILDENKTEILKFNNTALGMGRFNMVPIYGKKYNAIVTFKDGQKLSYALPTVYKEGISIHVKQKEHLISVILSTNENTHQKIDGKEFYLLIHRDGIAKKIPVTFKEGKNNSIYSLKKEEFLKGMNIITLFDSQEKPVLERLFFNTHGIGLPNTEISTVKNQKDSLTITLKTTANNQNLSISVLPENTIAYNHKDNILSTLYLKPYIKGFIENPAFYFNNIHQKKEQLDLLLLTQGWSKYNWNDITRNPPKKTFKFERGITFTGIINSKLKPSDNILVYTNKRNNLVLIITSLKKMKKCISL